MCRINPANLLVEDILRLVVDEIRLAKEVFAFAAVVVEFAVCRRVLILVVIEPRAQQGLFVDLEASGR